MTFRDWLLTDLKIIDTKDSLEKKHVATMLYLILISATFLFMGIIIKDSIRLMLCALLYNIQMITIMLYLFRLKDKYQKLMEVNK